MAVFVVDYGFCAGSHHYSSACSLQSAAEEAGVPFHVLAPASGGLAEHGSFPAWYVLSHRHYEQRLAERRGLRSFWTRFSARRAAVSADLERQLARRLEPRDAVLLTTPMAAEFAGFADWHAALPVGRRPRVAVHFLLPLGYDLAPDLPWQEQFAQVALDEAFARLGASSGGRALYLAHPRSLAERLAAAGAEVEVWPSPFALPRTAAVQGPAREHTVAVLGRGKPAKGIALAFEAFDRLQAARTPLRWIFQTAPLELSAARMAALAAPNVTHVADHCSLARYGELLRSASIIVLPYDPRAYADDQGSGVLCEALAMGIPVVCSGTGAFAEELEALGCPELIFRPYTADALVGRLLAVLSDYARYRSLFAERAPGFEAMAAPRRLFERLAAAPQCERDERPPERARPRRQATRTASLLSLLELRLRAALLRGGGTRAPRPMTPRGGV
jgi:glycosyltransferase involved in cell wall biosynthesis